MKTSLAAIWMSLSAAAMLHVTCPGAFGVVITLNPTADTWYDERPGFNTTGNTSVQVYGAPGNGYLDMASEDVGYSERIVMKFDTSILNGEGINSATLRLFARFGAAGDSLEVYRLTNDWNDKDSNWFKREFTANTTWTNPGGDFANALGQAQTLSSPFATRIFAENAGNDPDDSDTDPDGTPNDWNIKTLVQGWASGTWSNFGLLIVKPVTVNSDQAFFVDSDHPTFPQFEPQLIVDFPEPTGLVFLAMAGALARRRR